jgi:hypothetical protein
MSKDNLKMHESSSVSTTLNNRGRLKGGVSFESSKVNKLVNFLTPEGGKAAEVERLLNQAIYAQNSEGAKQSILEAVANAIDAELIKIG